MVLIISGSRTFKDYDLFCKHLCGILVKGFYKDIEIVSGGCSIGETTFIRDNGRRVCGADGDGRKVCKRKRIKIKNR